MLNFDYAKQVDVKSTMNEFFFMLRAYDVHLFDVRDLGAGVHTNYFSVEGKKHGSQAVISMLHRCLEDDPEVGNATHLHLQSEFCGGQ